MKTLQGSSSGVGRRPLSRSVYLTGISGRGSSSRRIHEGEIAVDHRLEILGLLIVESHVLHGRQAADLLRPRAPHEACKPEPLHPPHSSCDGPGQPRSPIDAHFFKLYTVAVALPMEL